MRDPTAAAAARRGAAGHDQPRPGEEQAWEQVIEDDTLANITTRSIVGGFVQPGQREVLAPFTARHFAAIPGGERRSSEVAQTVVIGLYPSWDISEDALRAATTSSADSCRRRCDGWSSRAAPASSAR